MEEFLTPMWRPVSISECAGPERPAESCSAFGGPTRGRPGLAGAPRPCRSSLPPRTRPHRAPGRRARPGRRCGRGRVRARSRAVPVRIKSPGVNDRSEQGADARRVGNLVGAGPQQLRNRPLRVAAGRLRVGRRPRLAVAGQHVAPVQVGVDERRRRRAGQLSSGVDGRVGQSRGHRGPECRLPRRDGGGDVGGGGGRVGQTGRHPHASLSTHGWSPRRTGTTSALVP